MEEKYIKTHLFIKNRWKDGLREERSGEYALPYPFEPPCVDGLFQCLFYWDTFFTNRGLIADGLVEIAKYNTDNLIYLLKKYKCVPNSNSYPGIKHASQPPYLQYMIEDVYNVTKDEEWLKEAYFALKIEYEFWMTKRITPIGLNQYLHHEKSEQELVDYYDYVCTRIAIDKNVPLKTKLRLGSSYNASCESGIDLTPSIGENGVDMVEIDLNCHLFSMEDRLARWAKKFEPELEEKFINAKERRLSLLNKYCLDKDTGIYWNFNFVKNRIEQKDFFYSNQLLPYVLNVSENVSSLKEVLSHLEYKFGVATTEKYPFKYNHQGAYPYTWPFDNYYAFRACQNLGLLDDAKRIAMKYLTACANSYVASGHLWEVYDATKDEIATKKEYPNAEMLGWTAGVYQFFYNYIESLEK